EGPAERQRLLIQRFGTGAVAGAVGDVTQGDERGGDTDPVAEGGVMRACLLAEYLRPSIFALPVGDHAGAAQRLRPRARRDAIFTFQRPSEPAATLVVIAARRPKPPERRAQTQRRRSVPPREDPIEGRPQVVDVAIQASQPRFLVGSPQLGFGLLSQRQAP